MTALLTLGDRPSLRDILSLAALSLIYSKVIYPKETKNEKREYASIAKALSQAQSEIAPAEMDRR